MGILKDLFSCCCCPQETRQPTSTHSPSAPPPLRPDAAQPSTNNQPPPAEHHELHPIAGSTVQPTNQPQDSQNDPDQVEQYQSDSIDTERSQSAETPTTPSSQEHLGPVQNTRDADANPNDADLAQAANVSLPSSTRASSSPPESEQGSGDRPPSLIRGNVAPNQIPSANPSQNTVASWQLSIQSADSESEQDDYAEAVAHTARDLGQEPERIPTPPSSTRRRRRPSPTSSSSSVASSQLLEGKDAEAVWKKKTGGWD